MPFSAEKIFISRHGGPEELFLETVPLPDPGEGEVVLVQDAIGVNFLDIYHRRGVAPMGNLPAGLGVEAAGTVEAIGPGVTRFKAGDRASYAGPPIGSYATSRVLPEKMLIRLPDGISNETAAAVTLQGMTAHMLMTRVRPLRNGETVLVNSAAGGLGLLIMQWAKSLGANVIGMVGSAEKAEIARKMGADALILYKDTEFVDAVRNITADRGVDVVYDGIGGDVFKRSLSIIKPFGLAVSLGQTGGQSPEIGIADLGPNRSLSLSVPAMSVHLQTVRNIQTAGDELFSRVLDGTLRVHVGGRIPLAEAGQAHRLMENGASAGSIVITG